MQNYGHLRPGETRAPETEILPDGRKRLTRFFEVTHKSKIPKELDQRFNTLDRGETPVAGWDGLRLTTKRVTDEVSRPGADTRPLLLLTFEEIDETAETPVGEANVTRLEDGRSAYVLEWLQFTNDEDGVLNPPTPRVVGSSITIDGRTAFLLKEEAPDDGCLRRIRRTYVTAGVIATDHQTKENGALEIRTITSVGPTPPATPPGFVLIGEPVQNPDGLPIYTYTFAKGAGLVFDSVDEKNGGKLVVYHRIALGAAPSTPGSTIGATVTPTSQATRKDSGYDIFDYTWAEGNGEISRETRYLQSTDGGINGVTLIAIRYLSDLTVTSNPITPPAGTALVSEEKTEQDGYRLWSASYAKGAGLALDEISIREAGSLIIYHRVALGAAPTPPAATIGGTVTNTNRTVRQDSGFTVYDYTWVEANGTIDSHDAGREDGSFVYYRTTISAAYSTPVAPAGSYLIDLDHAAADGYFVNRATFIKPPATTTYRRTGKFEVPGIAYFVGTDLILQPPTERNLLLSIQVSFSTAQIATTPFTVNTWGGMTETYIPTASGQPINRQIGLNGYLCSGTTISGSGTYKGVAVDSYSATRFASNPTAIPTGVTTLHVENEPYLTALDGTMVFKSSVTTATL